MAKGRNTTVLGTRIPDPMLEAIQVLADRTGMTMSEYVRNVLETQEELQLEMLLAEQAKHHRSDSR